MASQAIKSLSHEEMQSAVRHFRVSQRILIPTLNEAVDTGLVEEKVGSRVGIVSVSDDRVTVALDIDLMDNLIQERIVRDLVRHIQMPRKEADLKIDQHIQIAVETRSEQINEAIELYKQYIMKETLANDIIADDNLPQPVASKSDNYG